MTGSEIHVSNNRPSTQYCFKLFKDLKKGRDVVTEINTIKYK